MSNYNDDNIDIEDNEDNNEDNIDYLNETYKKIDENDKTLLIKISYRLLIQKIKHWSYNRELIPTKINELYESIDDNNIVWIFTAIKERSNNDLYLIDGQHRFEAIKRKINEDVNMLLHNKYIYINIYIINNIDTDYEYIIDLFNKINNNAPFNIPDFPSKNILKIINSICNDPILSKGLKKNDKTHTSYQPYIHTKHLKQLLTDYNDYIKDIDINDLIYNLKLINNKLSLKTFEELYYNKNDDNKNKWIKASKINFFLGLKDCYVKYRIDNIIKNVKNPNNLFEL